MRQFLLFPLLLTSCVGGSDDSGGTKPTDDTGTSSAGVDCTNDAWLDQADLGAREAWMGACFMPEVTVTLQATDSQKFASVTCSTCHGADFAGGTYKMPEGNELSWNDAGKWDPAYFDAATGTGGMADLSKQAAALLGVDPWTPENTSGFGCANCHQGL